MSSALPLITNIRRFALDDGPGIRTTVFFKGCPLACIWCHNPECILPDNEIVFHREKCIECGRCAATCTAGAISMVSPQRVSRSECTACGDCAEVCPATALSLAGATYPVDVLIRRLLRDRLLFETSGGGVTFSGGEPTLHMEYLGLALAALKQAGIHTAIQTCGMFDAVRFIARILPYTDLVFFDLKLIDPAAHARFAGAPNALILENFRRLTAVAKEKLAPRVPLVPGITATRANLLGIARLLSELGYSDCATLPYNPGAAKRLAVGLSDRQEVPTGTQNFEKAEELRREFLTHLTVSARVTYSNDNRVP